MKLIAKKLPATLRGIYGANKDHLGESQLYAHPDLYDAIMRLEADGIRLIYSDIWRSAASSLARRRQFEDAIKAYDAKVKADPSYAKDHKRPTQLAKRPGESPHNWGLSVDIDHARVMKERGINKTQLDKLLEGYGLYCHLRDHSLQNEAWHYNALGPNADQWLKSASAQSTSRAVEAKVFAIYGPQMILTGLDSVAMLSLLKFPNVSSFQTAWDLPADGKLTSQTQRLLAYLTSERVIV